MAKELKKVAKKPAAKPRPNDATEDLPRDGDELDKPFEEQDREPLAAADTSSDEDESAAATNGESAGEGSGDGDPDQTTDNDVTDAQEDSQPAVGATPDGFEQKHYPGMPSGIVLGPDDPVWVRGYKEGTYIVLTEGVYQAFMPTRSMRWRFRQVHARGAKILASKCKLLAEDPKPNAN